MWLLLLMIAALLARAPPFSAVHAGQTVEARIFPAPRLERAQVRWSDKYVKGRPILGEVTGHPAPRMVQVNGKGAISVGMLEEVGEMNDLSHLNDLPTLARQYPNGTPYQQMKALEAERDALQALIVQQCEAMANMAPGDAYDDKLQELAGALDRERAAVSGADQLQTKIEELTEWAANAASYLEDYLLAVYGERRPLMPIEPRELRDLVNFVFEGV